MDILVTIVIIILGQVFPMQVSVSGIDGCEYPSFMMFWVLLFKIRPKQQSTYMHGLLNCWPVKNITILGCCGGGCGGRCGGVRLWLGRPGTVLEDWGAPRSAHTLLDTDDKQVPWGASKPPGRSPDTSNRWAASTGLHSWKYLTFSSHSLDGDKEEPGEPVTVGVHLALALTAGEVLLVVEAEDVGLGEGAGCCSEPLAVAPLNLGEEGEEGDGDEKGEHHGNLGQSSESLWADPKWGWMRRTR